MSADQAPAATATAGTATGQSMTGARGAINRFGLASIEALRTHRLFIAIIVLYAVGAFAVGRITGHSHVVNINMHMGGFLVLLSAFSLAVVLGHTIWMAVVVRPEGALFPAIWSDFRTRFLQPSRIAAFLAVVALKPLFFSAFSSYKRMILYNNFWHWDPAFRDWDKWLHFGKHPWEWTHAVFGSPFWTSAISVSYNAWYFAIFMTFIWQAWSAKRPRLRMQFLYSFIFTWMILGTVFGTMLASGGPVYFDRIVPGADNPYAALMERLHLIHETHPVWALAVQERLWEVYQARGLMLGSGISAMPSLHVATCVLMAVLAWQYGRIAGIAFTAFAIIIQIGSVHLGWHYSIDGYVSAAVVLIIWFTIGRLLRWREAKSGR